MLITHLRLGLLNAEERHIFVGHWYECLRARPSIFFSVVLLLRHCVLASVDKRLRVLAIALWKELEVAVTVLDWVHLVSILIKLTVVVAIVT